MDGYNTSVGALTREYDSILGGRGEGKLAPNGKIDWDGVAMLLQQEASWTGRGASAIAELAREYGTFALRNALAVAVALDVEDGEKGL